MRKRFIAGAVCPQCQQQDTLALWQQQETEQVQCVSCGYLMQQSEKITDTRVVSSDQIIGIFTPD